MLLLLLLKGVRHQLRVALLWGEPTQVLPEVLTTSNTVHPGGDCC